MVKDLISTIRFAQVAHHEQFRKYTNEPYVTHPIAVMGLVASVIPNDLEMLIAAILHDTVEDTDVTLKEIQFIWGSRVANMVEGLTDVSKPEDGNRAKRKAIYRAHLATQSLEVFTIKLADIIDNTKTITAFDPDFAKIYMREKALLLDNILMDGNPILFKIASDITDHYFQTEEI